MTRVVALAAGLLIASLARAQEPPAKPPSLPEAIASYLAEADDRVAEKTLKDIISRRPDVDEVLSALEVRPPAFAKRFEMQVPLNGKAVRVRVEVPEGHGPGSPPLPVYLQLRMKRIPDTVRVPGVINAWPDFDPEPASEELRDGAVKLMHEIAWRANGDPEALWLAGFSVAGHAAFDVALRRPNTFRGIVPMAGAPRRVDYRLLPNLGGLRVIAMCGTRDDRELLWNLRDLEGRAKSFGFDYVLGLDPDVEGRIIPSPLHVPTIGPAIEGAGRRPDSSEGLVAADARGVRGPMVEILAVDESLTKVPRRIPVPAGLPRDEQRKRTVEATIDRRAELRWQRLPDDRPARPALAFRARGVTRARLFFRASWIGGAREVRLAVGDRGRPIDVTVRPSVRTILEDVRRTGRRHDPCLADRVLRF